MIKNNKKGYSLVEMSIVIIVLGIIGLLAVKTVTKFSSQSLTKQKVNSLQQINNALIGFIYAKHRLPCPDINGNGLEQCAAANLNGFLPTKTLNIKYKVGGFRYGVFRKKNTTAKNDRDLATLVNRYEPLLPDGATSNQLNGLDFCLSLITASKQSYTASNINSQQINPAYVIVDAGLTDADNDGNLFDGSNGMGNSFESSNRKHLNNYDDNVFLMGFNQLSGVLNCPKSLAQSNGMARASFAAYDMWRIANQYKEYRAFNLYYLELLKDTAKIKFKFATLDLTFALMSTALTAVITAITPGGGAISVGFGVAASSAATASEVFAKNVKNEAISNYNEGIIVNNQSIQALADAEAFKNLKLQQALLIDAKGLIK